MKRARRRVIVVFAKQPRPGFVKTRMCPPLSPEQAAELCAEMLADVLAATASFACELGLSPVLAVDPPAAGAELARIAPTQFRVLPQRGSGLAERMSWAVREAAAGGAERILLRGSDSPALDLARVDEALRALEKADLSVCPDRDGGYGLIGLRRPVAGLFAHPMSTRRVLADTLAQAAARGLRAHVLAGSFDLDGVEDLHELWHTRAAGAAPPCPRTLTWLERNDVWRLAGPGRGRKSVASDQELS